MTTGNGASQTRLGLSVIEIAVPVFGWDRVGVLGGLTLVVKVDYAEYAPAVRT